jgi:hypothetical protein|tara:strand:- start:336 stop:1235 length:900 start_codon:yes stop_codon:yes gene_type:complete
MNIREISKPVTAASLNESLAKRFGQRINLGKFTIEQLQDVRNKVRTTLSQVETNESFNSVQKEAYQKSKLFLDVLNAEISERGDIDEAAKPDFLDVDKDGDKKEPMKKAAKDAGKGKKGGKPKKGVVPPQFKKKNESIVKEGAEEAAELVMAAKDMVDRITGWMEDTAEMQTESMLELADSIRDEMGSEQSEAFTNSVKPALEALYTALEATREATISGVGILTGEAAPEAMGSEEEMPVDDADVDPMADIDVDAEVPAEDDGMAAAEPAVGGEEEAGRAKRESVERSRRIGTILSKKK